MKSTFLPLLIVLAFSLHPLATYGSEAQAQAPERGFQAPAPNDTIDLRFPGGTVLELIDHMEQALGRPPPVIVGEGARELQVPAFELHSAKSDNVFGALMRLLADTAPKEARLTIVPHADIWVINAFPAEASPEGQPQMNIFHIGPLLETFRLEDLTTAIETAWEMAGAEKDGRMRYHEETSLLFVRGNRDQLILVSQILNELRPMASPEQRQAEQAREIERRRQIRQEMTREQEQK